MCRLNSNNFVMKLPEEDVISNEIYFMDEFDDNSSEVSSPVRDGDFSEYMWMEHEDEFDSEVIRQLEEQELIDECVAEMVFDEINNTNGVVAGMQTMIVNSEAQTVNSQSANTASNSSTESSQHATLNGSISPDQNTGGSSQSSHRRSNANGVSFTNRLANVRAGLPANAVTTTNETSIRSSLPNETDTLLYSQDSLLDSHLRELFLNNMGPSTLNPNAKEFVPNFLADLPRSDHDDDAL